MSSTKRDVELPVSCVDSLLASVMKVVDSGEQRSSMIDPLVKSVGLALVLDSTVHGLNAYLDLARLHLSDGRGVLSFNVTGELKEKYYFGMNRERVERLIEVLETEPEPDKRGTEDYIRMICCDMLSQAGATELPTARKALKRAMRLDESKKEGCALTDRAAVRFSEVATRDDLDTLGKLAVKYAKDGYVRSSATDAIKRLLLET